MKTINFVLFFIFSASINSQWIEQTVVPSPPKLFSVFAYNSLTAWTCGDSGKVLYTSNGGTNWNYRTIPVLSLGSVYGIHAIGLQTGLCVGNVSGTGKIFKTTNAGINWTEKYSRNGFFPIDIEFMNSLTGFVLANVINNFWFILKTTDGGETYDSTSITRPVPLTPNDFSFPNDQVVIDNSGIPYVWFGSSNQRIYYSTNGGVSWNNSIPPGNQAAVSLTFMNIQNGFAGGLNFAFSTTTGGSSWIMQAGYPGSGPFTSFANISGFVWYSRGPCIYYSTNSGASFAMQHCSPNSSTYNHLSFTLTVGDNSMSVITGWGVTSDGVISKYTDISGIEKIGTSIPEVFGLEQNYPNPFNPVTKIRFSLPSDSKGGVWSVQVIIYDALGREVTKLIPPFWGGQEGLSPGIYEVEWDASKYPSGAYFYTLIGGKNVITKKMVLIK